MEFENKELTPSRSTESFAREGAKIGLVNGAIALALMYGSYFMGLDAFVNMQFIGKFIPYMIIILIIYGIRLRKQNGNYMPFKSALQFSFMSYVIAGLVIAIGTYILFNVVDPGLTKSSFELGLEKIHGFLDKMMQDPDKVEEQMEKLRRSNTETNLKNIFLGYGMGLIWDFILSLLIAVIIRKEKSY